MNILIFNCGSSSQNFKVYQVLTDGEPQVIASGKARNVATQTRAEPQIEWTIAGRTGSKKANLSSHRLAAGEIQKVLKENGIHIDAAGHRFVHGGSLFEGTARLDAPALTRLEQCLPLAPIHNPNSYSVIEACAEALPGIPQFAVFDTAFHARLPEEARRYAIPLELAQEYGFRKYGFHGLSYQYVSEKTAELMGQPLESLKLILCHLGTGGSSVAAVKDGHSIETSMGWSPLAGLVMSTRSGDLDPEIVLELLRRGRSADEIGRILNTRSGLLGLSGFSSNLGEVIREAEAGNADCRIAYEVYANRLKMYIGAYFWLLDGADAIVFTDEIGTHSWKLRRKVCGEVENLGIRLDEEQNRLAPVDAPAWLHRAGSAVRLLSLPTDEEWVILQEVLKALAI